MKKQYTFLFLLAAILFCSIKPVKAQVNVQDSLALVDLYNSTKGASWYHNDNWLTSAPVSDWYGVTVGKKDNDLFVTSLSLPGNNLYGNIPRGLCNLLYVQHLYLNRNILTGNIPPEFGKLENLLNIDLSNNALAGSIPTRFGQIHSLDTLLLNNNFLTGKIPSQLGNDTALTYVDFSYNKLSGSIPASFGNLSHLQNLSVSDNQLTGYIPSALGNAINLQILELGNNHIHGAIPSTLGNLKHLQVLKLNWNKLKDSIPSSLGNLSQLWYATFSNNRLSGKIPASFSKLVNLKYLSLSFNKLSDTVPSFLASLPELRKLYLFINDFTFNGLETLVQQNNFTDFDYFGQGQLTIHLTNNMFSVYAGGTLSNNTYKWFRNDALVATVHGDSTYQPTVSGMYKVYVTNAIATAIFLQSYGKYYDAPGLTVQRQIALPQSTTAKDAFSVFPNPAKTTTTLSFNASGKYTITIADASGRMLQRIAGVAGNGTNTVQLNVSKYAPGVYLITITNESGKTESLKLNKE